MPTAEKNNTINKSLQKRHGQWLKRLQEKEIQQETERVRMLNAVNEVLNELSTRYQWERAYIFGSVTQSGRFRVDSDIDIALKGLNKYQLFAFMGDISSRLSKNVDVVLLEETPFAQAIIEKGILWTSKIE